jgi:hypothetical protein
MEALKAWRRRRAIFEGRREREERREVRDEEVRKRERERERERERQRGWGQVSEEAGPPISIDGGSSLVRFSLSPSLSFPPVPPTSHLVIQQHRRHVLE